MMRFRIYSILFVVFGLLLGNGLQAQQLFNPQDVEALPLPEWHPPTGNSATPLKAVKKQLGVPYRIVEQSQVPNEVQGQGLETSSIQAFLKKVRQGSSNSNALEKAFEDLEIVDIGEYGSPEGALPFNSSVYLTVEIIIRTADDRLIGCSGVLVDPSTVLTTGRCIFNTDLFGPEGFASDIFVFPGYDQRIITENNLLEYGFTQGVSVETTTGWSEDQNLEFNLGVITLARPMGGTIAAYEKDGADNMPGSGSAPLMELESQNTFFFLGGKTFRNDGYPLGEGFEPQTQYTRTGSFEEVEDEILLHDEVSNGGMEGSVIYRPFTGDNITGYGVLSHSDNDQTAYVRLTDDKIDFVQGIVDATISDDTDLHPMVPSLGGIPDQRDPGQAMSLEGDPFVIAAYNYSNSSYTGLLAWNAFIVPEGAPVSEAIFLSETGAGFNEFTVGANSFVSFGTGDLFVVPEDTPAGNYSIGTILFADDDNPDNNNVIFAGDLTPIVIGDPSAVTLTVDPSEISVDGQAGSTTFDITSSIDWTVSEDADWLTVSASRGNGNATITIDYDQNPSTTESRSATITVGAFDGSVDPVTVTITQDALANFLFVMPDTLRVSGEAGTSSFTIETDLLWSVQESSDWFEASPTSGFGEGSVDLNYDRNSTDEARTSIISVTTSEGPSAEVVVIQEGAGMLETISVDPAAINVDASAGEAEVRVSSNTNWVAGGGDEWISFAPSAGDGDGIVTIKYDENTSLDSRQTTITFSTGSGESADVVITQAGAAAFISVDPATLDVDNGEGDASVAVNSNESWTANSDSEWLVAIPDAGSGDTDVIISYLGNDEIAARTGTITFTAASGETATVTVNQEGRARVTVVDIVVNSDVHNTLETAVIAAGLAGTLSGDGPFTVFAPTDDAFAALPEGTLETLLADPTGDLANILLYHVLGAKVLSTDLSDGQVATTLLGEDITVTINDNGVFINGAQVTTADIETDNGVVHVIDAVLLPPVDCSEAVTGGTVALEDGSTEARILIDGVADVLTFASEGANADASFTYVITDDQNNILGVPDGNTQDFDGAGAGVCRVWGLSYTGEIIAMAGDNAAAVDLSSECFELSSNFITVTRIDCANEVAGGTVALADGSTEATIIVDGEADVLTFSSTGANENASFTYVITDDQNNILGVPDGNTQDFDGAGVGVCRVWGLSYTGEIIAMAGDNAAAVDLSNECFALSSNFITVTREEAVDPTEGNVIINEVSACAQRVELKNVGDSDVDVSSWQLCNFPAYDQLGGSNVTIISGDLMLSPNEIVVLEWSSIGSEEGEVGIYKSGPFNSAENIRDYVQYGVGDNRRAGVAVSAGVWDDAASFIELPSCDGDNSISVDNTLSPTSPSETNSASWCSTTGSLGAENADCGTATSCDDLVAGGTVALEDGSTAATVTVGDDVSDFLSFMSMGAAEGVNFTYVITDDQNNILGLPEGNMADFDNAGAGTCRVWGLSYTGEIIALPGDNAAAVDLSSECFALSSNFITVTRIDCANEVAGGTVALADGSTEATIIVDGEADVLTFSSTGANENASFTYVITDDQNNILGVPDGNTQDFDGAGVGVCRVWGLSYTGEIIAMAGDNAAAVDLSNECFALSSNFITVTREEAMLSTTVVDIIVNSDVHNTLEAAVIAAELADDLSGEGPFTVFAPTDDAFAALPEGTVEMLLEDPTGDLANILLYHVLGAKVLSTDLSDGQVATTLEGSDITVSIDADGNVFINNAQVIVADLEADNGVVHVIDAVLLPPADVDCDEVVEGGTVALEDGSTEATIIVDGEADVLTFMSMGANEGASFTYVITDDQNNILGVPDGNTQDFDGAGVGVCRVWGLSYTGDIIAMAGDNAAAVDLSSECFELSSNFITVTREAAPLPATVVDIIVNSDVHNTLETAVGVAGLVDDLSGEGPFTVFAPTDDAFAALPEGVLEALLEEPTGDLTSILLYHVLSGKVLSTDLSDGQVATTLLGEDITVTINDDGVFINNAQVIIADLEADNGVVHVIDAVLLPSGEVDCEEAVEGGTVALEDGSTEATVTVGDGEADVLTFMSMGAKEDASFTYVITDDQNNILGIPDGNMQDFEGAGVGVCRVWGLSYTGDIIAEGGDNAAEVDLSSECFELSSNFITVTREEATDPCEEKVDGGTVALADGSTEATIIVDGEADVLTFTSEGANADANFTYVITDDQNNILGVPGDNTQDFDGAGVGICRVWGLSYTGEITAMVGDNAAEVDLSDDCFDLSDNFITVTREEEGGDLPSTVVEIIQNSDDHKTLEVALILADLIDDLSGEGQFTVFAPTDAAFAALPSGLLDKLLTNASDGRLESILLYHVLSGRILSSDLSDGQIATTLQGEDITVSITDGNVFINDAQVIVADIEAENGVVHVIDAVLVPEEEASSRFLEIRPPSRVVNQDAGETVFVVYSNTDWSITTDAEGVEFFPSVGSGTRFVKVVYDENTAGPAREVVLNVESTTGESGEFTLTQAGTDDFVAINPENVFVRAVQGSTSFDLVSSTDWTLSTDSDWITLTTDSGSGDATVSVDYASNGAFEIRTGTVTATTTNGATATINISQGASEDVEVFFELRPPSREVSGAAGEVQFVIFTNAIWNISSDSDWVEFFGTEGQGTAFIKVPYGENTTGETRTAELDVVTSTGESGVFTLTQTAAGDFIISNPNIDAPATIANFDFTLYPNPVSSLLNVRIDADEDRRVDVQVLDINGKLVKYYNSQAVFTGENTIQIDVNDLAGGIYYFRMIGQDVVKQTKFMVAH